LQVGLLARKRLNSSVRPIVEQEVRLIDDEAIVGNRNNFCADGSTICPTEYFGYIWLKH
jgi:hypothetical protein